MFVAFPGSARSDMTVQNAISLICANAREKLGLTGSSVCGE
jgi:hypothetical protein